MNERRREGMGEAKSENPIEKNERVEGRVWLSVLREIWKFSF